MDDRMKEAAVEGWKEAAIAWSVCASIHEQYAKGKDPLYTTRHGDYEKHREDARNRHWELTEGQSNG